MAGPKGQGNWSGGLPGAAAMSWEGDGVGLGSLVVSDLDSAPLMLPVKSCHSAWSRAWFPKGGASVSSQQRRGNNAESG